MIIFGNCAKIFLVASLCLQHVSSDTIVIEKVFCKQVATGISTASKAAVSALGAAIAGGAVVAGKGAVVIGTGGAAIGTIPVTAKAVLAAGASGASAAKAALGFFDKLASTKDNLIINISGQKVFPTSGKYYNIKAGETIKPNIRFDFDGKCRIQFIEFDTVGDNDNLGSIEIEDDVAPGKDYRVDEALLYSESEGDIYYVTYRVERNENEVKESWLMCGTAACRKCSDRGCANTSNKGLDRDKDFKDLRQCPPGFQHNSYKKYWQMWPFPDVYLRVCVHFPGLEHAGKDCWRSCGEKTGQCPNFCGRIGFCCRKGYHGNGCDGSMGDQNRHVCVKKGLRNAGKECWRSCGEKTGHCPNFCGNGGKCCRRGFHGNGCDGRMGRTRSHVCVG